MVHLCCIGKILQLKFPPVSSLCSSKPAVYMVLRKHFSCWNDSSVLVLDGETGNSSSIEIIHPKKPSKAIFKQVLG